MITDIAGLYDSLASRLERIVRNEVRAPAVVAEDACQFAWYRLVGHARRIDQETAMSWLVTTALREAVKLARRDQQEISLEERLDEDDDLAIASPLPGPHEQTECRERLAQVRRLPLRQQRFLWLRAVGYSYEQIAATEPRLTERIVERQIQRGRRALKAAA
jgi:RNA polymerase sigma factor (sigma-70 family)